MKGWKISEISTKGGGWGQGGEGSSPKDHIGIQGQRGGDQLGPIKEKQWRKKTPHFYS